MIRRSGRIGGRRRRQRKEEIFLGFGAEEAFLYRGGGLETGVMRALITPKCVYARFMYFSCLASPYNIPQAQSDTSNTSLGSLNARVSKA